MRACGSSMARSSPWELRLTPRARADLEDIWQYTAETWSVEQADRYIESLSGTFEALLAMPEMARERSEFAVPVRIHPSGQHVIIYWIEPDYLLIIRVLGARQDWRAALEILDNGLL
ncbi:type II toxin-antitoxin system RelE/ParE family toxin [Sinorhizobium fredii]|uniref:type II toxin-antitoxin system RelE/ParE family toxin n=2 Tax=Rhizobium fredii TaxID=380 RepID=UPI003518A5B4